MRHCPCLELAASAGNRRRFHHPGHRHGSEDLRAVRDPDDTTRYLSPEVLEHMVIRRVLPALLLNASLYTVNGLGKNYISIAIFFYVVTEFPISRVSATITHNFWLLFIREISINTSHPRSNFVRQEPFS